MNKPAREGGLSFARGDRRAWGDYAYRTEECVFWHGDMGETESEGEESEAQLLEEDKDKEGVRIKPSPTKRRRM